MGVDKFVLNSILSWGGEMKLIWDTNPYEYKLYAQTSTEVKTTVLGKKQVFEQKILPFY
jgi:hypothetical protein